MKRTLLSLAYTNLWIALAASAEVWLNCLLLGTKFVPTKAAIAFCSMFWVYTFAKTVRLDPVADEVNDPERTELLLKFRPQLISLGLLALGWGLWASQQLGTSTFVLFLSPLFAGLFYDLKFLPRSCRYRRLKDIPGIKGTVVAGSWTLLTVGLALDSLSSVNLLALLVVSAWTFLNWFINTTYFDLGDLIGDRAEGTTTLPVKFGYPRVKHGLFGLNALSLLILVWGLQSGILPPVGWAAAPIFLHHSYALLRARDENSDISWECDVLFDGMFLFAALYALLILALLGGQPC